MYDPEGYACLFPATIRAWRAAFSSSCPLCPFLFTELAAIHSSKGEGNFSALRLAQHAALALPRVAMATAIDLGDPLSPYSHWHPRDKQTVGARLAAAAARLMYAGGVKVNASGPALVSCVATRGAEGMSVSLTFSPGAGDEVTLKGTAGCEACCPSPGTVSSMVEARVAASDKWEGLRLDSVSGVTAVFSLPGPSRGDSPVSIRYAWAAFPQCVFVNVAGWPASPFIAPVTVPSL